MPLVKVVEHQKPLLLVAVKEAQEIAPLLGRELRINCIAVVKSIEGFTSGDFAQFCAHPHIEALPRVANVAVSGWLTAQRIVAAHG